MGANYLDICDSARGEGSSDARAAAAGVFVRAGWRGEAIRDRIFLRIGERPALVPADRDSATGRLSKRCRGHASRRDGGEADQEQLHASESGFRQVAENIRDVFYLVDADSNRILYISPAYEEIWGRSCASAYANPDSWTEAIHPDDRVSTCEKHKKGMATGKFEYEYRIVRPDGSMRWLQARGLPGAGRRGQDRANRRCHGGHHRAQADCGRAARERSPFQRHAGQRRVAIGHDRSGRAAHLLQRLFSQVDGLAARRGARPELHQAVHTARSHQELRRFNLALLANVPASWHHENEILTRSGERRLIRWNNTVLRSGAGDVIGTASIAKTSPSRSGRRSG